MTEFTDANIQELLGLAVPSGPAESPAEVLVPASAGGEMAMGAFEAADRYDHSLRLWNAPLQSADLDILPDKEMLDGRVRDLGRNDALIHGAANFHKDTIVGSIYMLNALPASRVLFGKQDDVWEGEFEAEVEELFTLSAESPDNWFDASRINTFTESVRLATGVVFAAGEELETVEWIREADRPFKTAFQMIDVDRLSNPMDKRWDSSIRGGIRKDQYGRPISYYIRSRHPADFYLGLLDIPTWKEVAARKPWGRPQVIHIFEQQRPDQTRGISDIVAAIKESKMGHKLRDLNLQAIAAKSAYAATITSDLPTESVFASILGGGQLSSEAIAKAVTQFATGYLSSINEFASSAKNLHIDGAKIPHLYPGTKLEFMSPGTDGPMGSDLERSLGRYLSVAAGISYEEFMHDFTGTNYSAIKAAISKTERSMRVKKKMVADRNATMKYRLWLEEMLNARRISSVSREMANPGWLYENQRLDAISRCEWIGAYRGQIDELKETQAAMLRINGGLSSFKIECAKLGLDWRKVYAQIAQETALRKKLGILDQNPDTQKMLNAASGAPRDKKNPKSNGAARRAPSREAASA